MQNIDQLSLVLVQGATWIKEISYLDTDEEPIDLSGYTAAMQFRNTVESTNPPVISISSQAGSIVIDGPNGTITPTISSTLTAALDPGATLYYDLFIYSITGIATRLISGQAIVSGSVTR